jgi:hypothetical protein
LRRYKIDTTSVTDDLAVITLVETVTFHCFVSELHAIRRSDFGALKKLEVGSDSIKCRAHIIGIGTACACVYLPN